MLGLFRHFFRSPPNKTSTPARVQADAAVPARRYTEESEYRNAMRPDDEPELSQLYRDAFRALLTSNSPQEFVAMLQQAPRAGEAMLHPAFSKLVDLIATENPQIREPIFRGLAVLRKLREMRDKEA